ncbi:MAG: DNA alkylation repair protein [Lachnospiraceae bacterium]|jgi:3-methyladenine DNA glycosylase AlkD|nr:DNA alkylation repair protein [Lachnospiraceae bacterium]
MDEIKQELQNLKNEELAAFCKKTSPDTKYKILGIRLPDLRQMAKNIAKENAEEFLDKFKPVYYEEVMLKGFVIGYTKKCLKERLELIKDFIPLIDGWGICDSFCATLKFKHADFAEVYDFILPYVKSNKEFEVRFAIICMLDTFIVDEYVDRVIKILDSIKHEGYYVKMGIAWCMAEIGIKFNDKFMTYFCKNNLDKFTHNKTISKLCDSYRITDEQKSVLRSMRIK